MGTAFGADQLITIAGGIVLAVLFLALLPLLIMAVGWLIGAVIVAAAACALIFLAWGAGSWVWTVGRTAEGLGALLIAAGAISICLHYYVKGRSPLSEQEYASRYPFLSAKLKKAEKPK
jgi:hypothetical protein